MHHKYFEVAGFEDLRPLISRAGVILVAEGVKPMATELMEYDQFGSVLDRLGLYYLAPERIRDDFIVTFFRDTAKAATFRRALTQQPMVRHRMLGNLYGYPSCCVEQYAFGARGDTSPFDTHFARSLSETGHYPDEFNYLMPSQTPCSIACATAVAQLSQWKATLEYYDPEAAAALRTFNQDAYKLDFPKRPTSE